MHKWIKWNKRSKMNVANKMLAMFNKLPYDGYVIGMKRFRNKIKQKASIIQDVCPESLDSPWKITFRDGSKAFLNNPYQEVFCARFYAQWM